MKGTITVESRAPWRIGGLAADEEGGALLFSLAQGLGHHVDAVHPAGAVFIRDLQLFLPFVPGHAMVRAEIDDFFADIDPRSRIRLDFLLIDVDLPPSRSR